MPILDVPDRYLAAAPIIVTSPTTRCGTTLAQRLLSAADNAFIYGEGIGNHFRLLSSLFAGQIIDSERNRASADETFRRALDGTLDGWAPAVAPPSEVVLRAWIETYYQMPAALSDFGQSIGRPVWGFKWPACPHETVVAFLGLMPRARVVYMVRDLEGALMSAKARKFVCTPEEVAGFCAQWARNMGAFAGLLQDRRVLFVRHEALLTDAETQIARLAAFAGVNPIPLEALGLKVNTFVGDEADGHSPAGYIQPEPLTKTDRAAMQAHAGAAMAEYSAG